MGENNIHLALLFDHPLSCRGHPKLVKYGIVFSSVRDRFWIVGKHAVGMDFGEVCQSHGCVLDDYDGETTRWYSGY